jgi:hypothetical protein
MNILLISGYKTTGKDFLCSEIISGADTIKLWTVFRNPYCNKDFRVVTTQFYKGQRFAFADSLKDIVHKELGLPTYEMDKCKDILVLQGKSLRQHYIDTAVKMKNIDIDCFVKLFHEKHGNQSGSFIITDWRFPHELSFINQTPFSYPKSITTTRVFDKNIPMPKNDDNIERSLESFSPDFVLLKQGTTFLDLINIFPQFSTYKHEYCC